MLGDRKTAILRGGSPWGFRLAGGGHTPVYISKVRSRSKAALSGLTAGDTLISVNGISSLQHSLREINDVIDNIHDQLVLEVQSLTHPRGVRLDSNSSLDTKENSPVRSINRVTPQPQSMDYQQYSTARITPTYPSHTSTSGFNQYDNNRDQRYMDSYGRSITNPLPAIFRTAAATSNSPLTSTTSTRGQPFSYRQTTSNPIYDTPRSYNEPMSSGYISDTNDARRSSISFRPKHETNSNTQRVVNTNNQQSYYSPSPVTYNTTITTSNDQNYYSDSEYVSSGPRYTKISRKVNTNRRPSNIVLPIRSMTSKAYDQYVPPESPKPQQQLVDVYRYQQEQQRLERERLERERREREQREREQREREQRERERQEQLQRQLYQQQQQQAAAAAAARFRQPPPLTLPSQDQRRKSDITIDPQLGADLKSPIANKKLYADSSFFKTPFNTYPTIEEQKQMARKIASILQGGDPTQKGASKFEKQRQRAEKYALEVEPTTPTLITSNYRPLRPLQTNNPSHSNHHQQPYYDTSDVPECIKRSIDEAQHTNPLRSVGAPDEFKQLHMQETVTHTTVPPQVAMSIAADLNKNLGKGAALFQKRKARSEKWVIDENNVKKPGHQPTSSYIGPTTKPWGQHAPASWSGDEGPPYSGPSFSPVKPKFKPPPVSSAPESIFSPPPPQNVPRFGDFNAKPKGFGTWNAENVAPQSPRESIDLRKPLNLSMEPSIREGIAESHTRTASQPFSPSSLFSPNQQQANDYFNYPSENILAKWKNQEYSPWNQSTIPNQQQSQIPMTREGVEQLRQRLTQQNQSTADQQYKQYASGNSTGYNQYSTPQQGSTQQHHFTDL